MNQFMLIASRRLLFCAAWSFLLWRRTNNVQCSFGGVIKWMTSVTVNRQ